jgi:hypothetical protein
MFYASIVAASLAGLFVCWYFARLAFRWAVFACRTD